MKLLSHTLPFASRIIYHKHGHARALSRPWTIVVSRIIIYRRAQ